MPASLAEGQILPLDWRAMRRSAMILACLVLLLSSACRPAEPTDTSSVLAILSPAEGARIRHARVDIAIQVSSPLENGVLRVQLQDLDLSRRFEPPRQRMRSLGGHAVSVATVNLDEFHQTGEMRIQAEWVEGGLSGSASCRFFYLPPDGRLEVGIRSDGELVPARLFVEGLGGTQTPDFSTPGLRAVDPRARESPRPFIDTAGGTVRLALAPGRYFLTAFHGIEYTAPTREVEVRAGKTTRLQVDLDPVVPTPGWISADLHVHASPSLDSFLPLDQRVIGYLAAGVEVMVATDHNMLTDYGTTIQHLPGAAGRITAEIGVETAIRPRDGAGGHWNLFPFASSAGKPVRPWPLTHAKEPAEIYRLYREGGTEPRLEGIIQVNHPRGMVVDPEGPLRGLQSAAWFSAAGLRPDFPILADGPASRAGPNAFLLHKDESGHYRNLDFDALEILNRFSLDLYHAVRRDWFALLNAGIRYTGTANSDSHHRIMVGPGFPRNLVRVGLQHDQPSTVDMRQFNAAIREGRVMGTTGPILSLKVGERAGPGETMAVPPGTVSISLQVRAAPWIPVRQVRLIRGGQTIYQENCHPVLGQVDRWDAEILVPVESDTWILAEAGEPLEETPRAPAGLYARVAPGFYPLAFTNPVFIDVGGNGWHPQSLPRRPGTLPPSR